MNTTIKSKAQEDLLILVEVLANALRKADPNSMLPAQAKDYLANLGKRLDDATPAEWSAASRAVQADSGLRLTAHLERQRAWSLKTFGPGKRTNGLLDHASKELVEIRKDPDDTSEWIDLAILAFEGAMRHGATPTQVTNTLLHKQTVNENRTWPDWRLFTQDQAIEHDRSGETHGR